MAVVIKRATFFIIIIFVMAGFFGGCQMIDDDRSNVERVKLTGEYFDILSKYNSVAREFSRTVKPLQDTSRRMNNEFNEEYWERFEKNRATAVVKMNELKSYEFKYDPFRPLKPEFVSFVAKMEHYLTTVENMRKGVTEWTPDKKKNLYAALDPLYNDILQQSKDITEKIDLIYNRYFVTGENAQ